MLAFLVALVFVPNSNLPSVSLLAANSAGPGYQLSLGEWEGQVDKPQIDLSSLSLTVLPEDRRESLHDAKVFPWYQQGLADLVELETEFELSFRGATLPMPVLPDEFLGARTLRLEYLATHRNVPGTWVRKWDTLSVVVPGEPIRPPSDKPGQKFIILPGSDALKLHRADGTVLDARQSALKPLTLIDTESTSGTTNRFWLQLGGESSKVWTEGKGGVLEQPGLEPIVQAVPDPNLPPNADRLSAFRKTINGGAGVFGGSLFLNAGDRSEATDVSGKKVDLVGVYRLWRTQVVSVRSPRALATDHDDSVRTAIHPLVAVVKLPRKVPLPKSTAKGGTPRSQTEGFFLSGDVWHLERQLTDRSETDAFAKASTQIRSLWKARKVGKGMNPLQVLWIWGPPDQPLELYQLLNARDGTWHYGVSGYGSWAATFKDGLVVSTYKGIAP